MLNLLASSHLSGAAKMYLAQYCRVPCTRQSMPATDPNHTEWCRYRGSRALAKSVSLPAHAISLVFVFELQRPNTHCHSPGSRKQTNGARELSTAAYSSRPVCICAGRSRKHFITANSIGTSASYPLFLPVCLSSLSVLFLPAVTQLFPAQQQQRDSRLCCAQLCLWKGDLVGCATNLLLLDEWDLAVKTVAEQHDLVSCCRLPCLPV